MTLSRLARSWMPDTALNDGRLDEAVETIVSKWVSDWLPQEIEWTLETVDLPEGKTQLSGPSDRITLNDGAGKEQWLQTILSRQLDDQARTVADDVLLSGLIDAAVSAITGMFPKASDCSSTVIVKAYSIKLASQVEFVLTLDRGQASEIRRSLAKPISNLDHRLGDLNTAVRLKTVQLEAKVDSLEISFEGLQSLKPGDILTSSKSLADSFELRANGNPCRDIAARYVVMQSAKGRPRRPGLILEMKS